MSKIVRTWKNETHPHSLCAEEQAMLSESLSEEEIELTDAELETVRGAQGHSSAPVSPTCLQSIVLGEGHCGTQG